MELKRPATPAEVALPDEHAGHGGQYLIDPATGKRRLVARTGSPAEAKAAPAAEPTVAPDTEE